MKNLQFLNGEGRKLYRFEIRSRLLWFPFFFRKEHKHFNDNINNDCLHKKTKIIERFVMRMNCLQQIYECICSDLFYSKT